MQHLLIYREMYLAKSTKRTKPQSQQPIYGISTGQLTTACSESGWIGAHKFGSFEMTHFFPHWKLNRYQDLMVPPPARAHFEPMSFVMVLRTNSPKQHQTDWMFKKKKKKSWVVAAGAMFVWCHRSLAFSRNDHCTAYMYKFIRPMPHRAHSKLNKILKSYCV